MSTLLPIDDAPLPELHPELTVSALLEAAPDAQSWLSWRGLDELEEWDLEETLGELCAQWELDWEELAEELLGWLLHEDGDERAASVEWDEALSGGEE